MIIISLCVAQIAQVVQTFAQDMADISSGDEEEASGVLSRFRRRAAARSGHSGSASSSGAPPLPSAPPAPPPVPPPVLPAPIPPPFAPVAVAAPPLAVRGRGRGRRGRGRGGARGVHDAHGIAAPAAPAPAADAPPPGRRRSHAQDLQFANARAKRMKLIGERLEAEAVDIALEAHACVRRARPRRVAQTRAAVVVGGVRTRRKRRRLKTKAKRSLRNGGGKGYRLEAEEDLDCGYSRSLRAKDVAIQCKVSESTAKDTTTSVAAAYMEGEIQLAEQLLAECLANPPLFAGSLLKWDEAKASIACPVFSELFSELSSKKLGWGHPSCSEAHSCWVDQWRGEGATCCDAPNGDIRDEFVSLARLAP